MAPRRRVVSDPDSVLGNTGPSAGRCVRPQVYPGAKIIERDWPLGGESGSTHAGQVCCAPKWALAATDKTGWVSTFSSRRDIGLHHLRRIDHAVERPLIDEPELERGLL